MGTMVKKKLFGNAKAWDDMIEKELGYCVIQLIWIWALP